MVEEVLRHRGAPAVAGNTQPWLPIEKIVGMRLITTRLVARAQIALQQRLPFLAADDIKQCLVHRFAGHAALW